MCFYNKTLIRSRVDCSTFSPGVLRYITDVEIVHVQLPQVWQLPKFHWELTDSRVTAITSTGPSEEGYSLHVNLTKLKREHIPSLERTAVITTFGLNKGMSTPQLNLKTEINSYACILRSWGKTVNLSGFMSFQKDAWEPREKNGTHKTEKPSHHIIKNTNVNFSLKVTEFTVEADSL